jgi:ADP-heptose:LPS heptosyltransferase
MEETERRCGWLGGQAMLARMLVAAEGSLRSATMAVPARAKHVLILEYMLPLGCLVNMTPVFEAIKQSRTRDRPEIEITVATRGAGLQLLRHSPFVDQVIETPDPTTALRAAVRTLRRELRRRALRPDCVLTGASDQRTRIALMAMLGSEGWRGGYTVNPSLYQRPLAYDHELSLIQNNLRVAKLIGCERDVSRPSVFFSGADAAAAGSLLRAANPLGRPVVVMVTQNSGGQCTGWHVDRFAAVVRAAAAKGCAAIYVGTAGEALAIEAVRHAAGGIGTSLAGMTSVSELAALLAMSDFAVTLDTGTMHVGRAIGVPMVVLAPSWQGPIEWLPLGIENVRILRGKDRVGVPAEYRLDEISAADALSALVGLMRSYPASASARERRMHESLSDVDHLAVVPKAEPASISLQERRAS